MWFKEQRDRNVPISGPILAMKANDLPSALGIEAFNCNSGWIHRFKKRHQIPFLTISGESNSVNLEKVNN